MMLVVAVIVVVGMIVFEGGVVLVAGGDYVGEQVEDFVAGEFV